ncbi:hypothetical protein R5R35_011960 [Gryllus longicercus]|uniref:Arrestin C-terminal-like domain-containing protein n=1 Tax=Gryllus longicercus TaxID=2509291 RepID=A0AAN9VDK9_9ORTH
MSVEYFRIHFDNPYATFFCGETVTGHVALKLKKEKRLRAIEIKFFGASEVKWQEHYTQRQGNRNVTRTIVYYAQEVYIDNTACVLGGQDGDTTLPPGEYTYHFALVLPPALPSSFEGTIGHVRYTVKAKIVRPWRFNHESKVAYSVLSVLDLNNVANIQVPLTASVEKTLCCMCCRSGPVALAASLPFSGFVPGQRVQMLLEVDNQSSSQVTVKCSLVQKVMYTAASGFNVKSMEARITVEQETLGVVEKKGSKNFQSGMVIPPLPTSFLLYCNCIEIAYFLEVEGVISGVHTNAVMEIPIVIGMIPLRNQFQSIQATDAQVPSTSEIPTVYVIHSSPPGYDYPDLPPPSYEECVSGRADIRSDDDSKDLQGSTDFAPRYPMYRFQ